MKDLFYMFADIDYPVRSGYVCKDNGIKVSLKVRGRRLRT